LIFSAASSIPGIPQHRGGFREALPILLCQGSTMSLLGLRSHKTFQKRAYLVALFLHYEGIAGAVRHFFEKTPVPMTAVRTTRDLLIRETAARKRIEWPRF